MTDASTPVRSILQEKVEKAGSLIATLSNQPQVVEICGETWMLCQYSGEVVKKRVGVPKKLSDGQWDIYGTFGCWNAVIAYAADANLSEAEKSTLVDAISEYAKIDARQIVLYPAYNNLYHITRLGGSTTATAVDLYLEKNGGRRTEGAVGLDARPRAAKARKPKYSVLTIDKKEAHVRSESNVQNLANYVENLATSLGCSYQLTCLKEGVLAVNKVKAPKIGKSVLSNLNAAVDIDKLDGKPILLEDIKTENESPTFIVKSNALKTPAKSPASSPKAERKKREAPSTPPTTPASEAAAAAEEAPKPPKKRKVSSGSSSPEVAPKKAAAAGEKPKKQKKKKAAAAASDPAPMEVSK